MIEIQTSQAAGRLCNGVSRRTFLRVGSLGVGGLTLADLMRLRASGDADSRKTHKSVIVVFLNGGASQSDMFDMKPKAPAEFRGEFSPISSNVPGVDVSELLPKHAAMMDKMSIVNGIQVITSGHSLYEASTGFAGNVQPRRPSIGAVVSRFGKNTEGMPPWTSMAGHSDPAFLGPEHAGFNPSGGLMRDLFTNGGLPADRVSLLKAVDNLRRDIDANQELLATDTFTDKALQMLSSTRIREAFDVKQEPEKIRERYGKQNYGGVGLLQALRLAQAGVSLITVYGPGNGKWDTHKDNFKVMKDTILPHYDQSLTAMFEDLYARGLDKDVLIAIYGEFGRTPRINKNAGRDHYPQSGFVQFVGGGLSMGKKVGDTGIRGDWDISRGQPYTIQNIISTMYHVLGIDPSIKVPDNFGRPQYLLAQRNPVSELM
ncbi:MAG: DUF1501 domain-containing protein [Planctomycetota bacterium]|nr:DUF1501 domain-containing protein [Planctomycetota bacterium]